MADRAYSKIVLKHMSTKDLQDAYIRLNTPQRYNEVDEINYTIKEFNNDRFIYGNTGNKRGNK